MHRLSTFFFRPASNLIVPPRVAPASLLGSLSRFSLSSSTIYNAEDLTIDIGKEKPSYRGSLVVVPTPIGNLGDVSVRQMEALTDCDIIACEDTRKTGKLLELLFQKRMKDRFKAHFGANFDTFMDGEEEFDPASKRGEPTAKAEMSDTEVVNQMSYASEPSDIEDNTNTSADNLRSFFSTDKDEMLLHKLQWANSQLEKAG